MGESTDMLDDGSAPRQSTLDSKKVLSSDIYSNLQSQFQDKRYLKDPNNLNWKV